MAARLSLLSLWFMLLTFFLAHVVLVGCAHVRAFVSCYGITCWRCCPGVRARVFVAWLPFWCVEDGE